MFIYLFNEKIIAKSITHKIGTNSDFQCCKNVIIYVFLF